jgi:hypothetical protein
MPFERRVRHRLRQLQELSDAVAVVVVRDVSAPVHKRKTHIARRPLLVEVVGVDLSFAAVHFEHRRDECDDVAANVADKRRVFDDQPVRELDERFRTAGFR